MFSYIRETDDSTTVNFSTYGKFIPSSGSQLVTIGAKFLRIFRTNPYALVPPADSTEEWQQKTRLECVFSTRFLNSPKDFAVSQIPSHPNQDALLLTFDDAKLSIVVFNESERCLETVSLHSYEDEYLREGFTKNCKTPIIRTDPSHRCAALLAYGTRLVIIPFNDGQPRLRSYTVPLKKIDTSLDNVADMVFLDGYHEPTLLFLYEPLQTTAGRAAIRYDTCCIMGVSVNSMDEQFAVVWQLSNLPMDCNRLMAVPKPIGGAVVFGSNEIIYLNQAVPPCGIAINSCHDAYTKFPLKDMKHLCLTLDCYAIEWIGDGKIFVGTQDGRLCVTHLESDSASSVKSIDFKFICETSIAYSLTACAAGHLFVGSRLGDSQFLKYAISNIVIGDDDDEGLEVNGTEPEAKRMKKGEIELDEDDLALYGDTIADLKTETTRRREQHIEVTELDRLLNIGPVKAMTAGGAHGTSAELLERANSGQMIDPVFDIVTASGHHKDGALCIMQRTLRPQIITSSSLYGAQQMWAVGRSEDDSHRYLIVSKARSTLVLELGEEMVELEEALFVTSEPTIAAGELADGGLAVQITSLCVALVADGQKLQEVQLESNFPVVSASIMDPFVALLTQDGRLFLYQLTNHPHVHLKPFDLSQSPFADHRQNILTSISIYRDISGLMVCSTGREEFVNETEFKNTTNNKTIDDEMDALYNTDDDFKLYGESTSSKKTKTMDDFSRRRKRHGNVIAATGGEESDAFDPNTGKS
ncbi:hypothetical protein WR25_22093 [Diploscapter pachys]|uniref:Uncharacterized protein n=1 Tax=Diploscapter pachys TaxID=2018661 RepID=A0A2A2LW20_9BILA|nr:hypothetical protein WR25_22093 [Diploscapter pachys]